jgi:hypothetical protein
MARINYCVAKFSEAVLGMAASTEGLQGRLSRAMLIDLSTLHVEDFPPHLVPQFRYILAQATKNPGAGNEGSLHEKFSKMSMDEARSLIEKIVALFEDVLEHYYREQFERRRPS